MGSRRRVDALGVLGGKPGQDLYLPSDQPVPLGVGVADGPSGATGGDRLGDEALGLADHRLQVVVRIAPLVRSARWAFADEIDGWAAK